MVTKTEISFYKSGTRDAARYVSADTVYEEALEFGRWIGLYWSASGQVQRENTSADLPGLDSLQRPIHTFELEIDGQSVNDQWEWVNAFQRPGERTDTVEAVVELRHKVRALGLKVVTRLDGSPILVRYLEITNTGSSPAALAAIAPWAGILWNTNTEKQGHPSHANPSFQGQGGGKFLLGYFSREEWGNEGNFVWQSLPEENFRIERKSLGRSWGSPYFMVKNQATGEMFFAGLAWSGNYFAEFAFRHGSILSFRMGPLAPAPLRVILPGETVRSPEVHLGPVHGSLDKAVSLWHQHMRTSVIPTRPAGKEMSTMAARVVEEPGDWILREIDIAAEMGVEAFMVDAGWYGDQFKEWPEQRGDWYEGAWLPGGMKGLRGYIHAKKMLFGLWHEAEAVSNHSRLHQDHPDWTLSTSDGRACAETLDLSNPKAAAFFEATVERIVGEFQLDFYKLDYNVTVGEGGQSFREGYYESEFWRHYEVVYRTYDRLRMAYPQVCLENCAGGGGRNDLGMLSRFHYACESDWSVMPYSIRCINAMTLFIPPESICYYHNHINAVGLQAHQLADADTHLRVTLFALPIFVGFGAQSSDRSTAFYQKTRRYIDLNKSFCRSVMTNHPVVYHHTPDIGLFSPAQWCVLEYGRRDLTRGYAGLFKLGDANEEYLFRPQGLDLNREYEVTLDNRRQTFRSSGRELVLYGLPVRLDCALTSELILFEAIK